MIIIVAAVFSVIYLTGGSGQHLVLRNADTGVVIDKWEVCDGFRFSVEYTHSVNKTPVRDNYIIKDGSIRAESTVYSSFGAGVQTFIEDGQTLTYDDDGNMIVSGFDITYEKLDYIIGSIAGHTLYINGDTINMHDMCGNNTAVTFYVK